MQENVFERLGFTKTTIPPEESGQSTPFYYYCYEFGDTYNKIILISNSSDDEYGEKGEWHCYFDFTDIKVTEEEDLIALINIFKKITK